MKRTVIKIDEDRCTGCGSCVKSCHGGALQLIDGKAKIVNEMYCDGLGACIGECTAGAISLEEREVAPYKAEPHIKQHDNMLSVSNKHHTHVIAPQMTPLCCSDDISTSRQFPIQLRLINPNDSFLQDKELVLAADCTAFVYSRFQHQFMKNNSIAIACPKLDNQKDFYVEKLTEMINHSSITSLTVIIMEVPCCRGLWQMALQAQANATRKIPVNKVIIGINGSQLFDKE
jgi:NAD-dependent dihydropyrimidine dehydrogenase PreA subunit